MKQGEINLLWIIAAVILLAIIMAEYLSISTPFTFAGFTFDDLGQISQGCSGGASSAVNIDSQGFLIVKGQSSGKLQHEIQTDVTGIDELLIIYDGYSSAFCNLGYSNAAFIAYGKIVGSSSGEMEAAQGYSTSGCPSSSNSVSSPIKPSIWKFKNNFDGTWSYLEGLGIGDTFIVRQTQQITGDRVYLKLGIRTSADCQAGGQGYITIYNIVRKENAFAVCKADKYAYDINKDGVIATDGSECLTLNTIVLNSEEAIKEGYNEKLARVTAELEAKNAGLATDIATLKQQLANQQQVPAQDNTELMNKINKLEIELKETKSILADVQAGDKKVINTIIIQEQFKKPNFIIEFFNKIIAFFKNLFK